MLSIKREELKVPVTIFQTEEGIKPYCAAPLGNNMFSIRIEKDGKTVYKGVISEDIPFVDYGPVKEDSEFEVVIRPKNIFKAALVKPLKIPVYYTKPRKIRTLVVGTGRCGTKSLTSYLNSLKYSDGSVVKCQHETLAYPILKYLIEGDMETPKTLIKNLPHDIEVATGYAAYFPELVAKCNSVLLVRDGRDVVSSGVARGWFARNSIWDKVKPDFKGTVFEKSCELWATVNERLVPNVDKIFRLEDISRFDEKRHSLLDSLQIEKTDAEFPKININKKSVLPHSKWSDFEHEAFERICGEIMDKLYPEWREAA
jgi:hypothetical protein